jgi:DNA-binding MarR family transcriptional regulator
LDKQPIGLLAAAVRRRVKQLVLSRVEPLGLSLQQFWILVGIAECPGGSQCEIAGAHLIDEPSASRVVRTLITRGWVRTVRDEPDRRRVRVELTPAGRKVATGLLPIARSVREAIDAPLGPEERERTCLALGKIVAHLEALALAAPRAPLPRKAPRPGRRTRTRGLP